MLVLEAVSVRLGVGGLLARGVVPTSVTCEAAAPCLATETWPGGTCQVAR